MTCEKPLGETNQPTGRRSRAWTRSLIAGLLGVMAFGAGNSPANQAEAGDAEPGMSRACVLLRIERSVNRQRVYTYGSGVFVSSEGHVLTSWQVVADRLDAGAWGLERRTTSKVLGITAVIDSGTANQREVRAKIIARDQRSGLALLGVTFRPSHFIDINMVDDVRVAEEIWIMGYPIAELTPVDRGTADRDEAGPETSVTPASVTSLRRSPDGNVALMQTDAALSEGQWGGPTVNTSGHLAGIVAGGAGGGGSGGLAVSPYRVREFLVEHAVEVDVQPGIILDPPQPLMMKVRPLLVDLESSTGTVRLDGADIDGISVELQRDGTGLEGEILFPDRIPGRFRPSEYAVTLSLSAKVAAKSYRRQFSLDAVPESLSRQASTSPSGGGATAKTERATSQYPSGAYSQQRSDSPQRLADIAGSTKLKKDATGEVVVDDHRLYEIGTSSEDPARFERIEDPDLRRIVRKYDRLTIQIVTLREQSHKYLMSSNPEERKLGSELFHRGSKLREERYALKKEFKGQAVLWCESGSYYFVSTGSTKPCKSWKTLPHR